MDIIKSEILDLLKKQVNLTSEEAEPLLERPAESRLGDYALACFKLSKKLKKSPEVIAADLVRQLRPQGLIQHINQAGGYINFCADPNQLVPQVLGAILQHGRDYGKSHSGQGQTVVIDFSSPNIAKPFGIAHLRSTVLGNALYRIYQALGYHCIGINHLGDWGTQFGHVIYGWKKFAREELEPLGRFDVSRITLEEATKYYALATSAPEPTAQENARREFKLLEDGNPENVKLWHQFRDKSLEEFERIYQLLGIKFDRYEGEAFYHQFVPATINEIAQKQLSTASEGALMVNLEPYGLPPCLLRKSDGAALYAARDIAAALYRYQQHSFTKMLYVVGADQKLHFQQVFKVLALMGYDWAKDCVHVDFGLIRFKGEKMSTRQGKTILLEDVLTRTIELSRMMMQQRAPELQIKVSPAQMDAVARAVGMGAVIFNDLKNKRTRDSDFDWDRMLSFEGETGPYLQYTHVRLASLTKKYRETWQQNPEDIALKQLNFSLLNQEDEIGLVKRMNDFPEVIQQAVQEYEPSYITNYLLGLASDFNRYYRYHRIVSDDKALSQARLSLCLGLKYVIHTGLSILGITALEEM